LLIFSSSSVLASGYFLPGRGVRAMSRAGAFVVGADDSSALWYNPAQLAAQKGTRLHLDAAMISPRLNFQRYPTEAVGEIYSPVENDVALLPGATLGISSDFGLDDFVLALGFYTPYGNWNRYPEDGAQRYSNIRSENLAYYLQFSLAWQPIEGLRIGAGMSFFTLSINDTNAVSSFPGLFGMPEDRDLDGFLQILADDHFIPNGVFGIWFHPGAWLAALEGVELGFSFTPSMAIEAEGRMRIRLPNHIFYDDVTVDPTEPPVTVSFNFPWIVRSGIRYCHKDLFDIELDFIWEGWSNHTQLEVVPQQATYYHNVPTMGDFLLNPTSLERHYQDTYSIRLGGHYRLSDWLVVRSGFLWETGAPPDEYFSVATPDSDKFGIALGIGTVWKNIEFDLAYMHLFISERNISNQNSLVTQINPNNPEGASIVGGGHYTSSVDMLGLSVLIRLDEYWK
jgi:long-chain fatty acid transport protein